MSISIEDYEIKQPILVAKWIKIEVISVILGERAYLRVSFYKDIQDINSYGAQLSTEIMDVYGEEYSQWGTDDTYLETLVLTKYGLTRRPNEPVIESAIPVEEASPSSPVEEGI